MGKSAKEKERLREEAAKRNRILWFWRIAGIVLAIAVIVGKRFPGTSLTRW